MPASSKAQQRFFGVVKAMQKGDKPKEGEAGKVAKSMKKKDVDKYAKTKHKGLPNKVKREQKVRELIKKMVREIMAEDSLPTKVTDKYKKVKTDSPTEKKKFKQFIKHHMAHSGQHITGMESEPETYDFDDTDDSKPDVQKRKKDKIKRGYEPVTERKLNEKVQKYVVGLENGEVISGDKAVSEKKAHQIMSRMFDRSNGWVNPFMIGVEVWNGTHPKSKGKPHKMNKKKIMIKEGFDLKKLEIVIKSIQKKIAKQGRVTNARDEQHLKQLIKVYKDMGGRKIKEGTCGYGENGQLGEEPAGPHLIKKKKIKESQVAKTILQQLGGNKFIAMTGAKNFGSSRNSLQFKIGRNSKSISHVIITLKSSDLYDVEFIRMRGTSRKVVKKLKGVYADQLQKMFQKYTGLRTRL